MSCNCGSVTSARFVAAPPGLYRRRSISCDLQKKHLKIIYLWQKILLTSWAVTFYTYFQITHNTKVFVFVRSDDLFCPEGLSLVFLLLFYKNIWCCWSQKWLWGLALDSGLWQLCVWYQQNAVLSNLLARTTRRKRWQLNVFVTEPTLLHKLICFTAELMDSQRHITGFKPSDIWLTKRWWNTEMFIWQRWGLTNLQTQFIMAKHN